MTRFSIGISRCEDKSSTPERQAELASVLRGQRTLRRGRTSIGCHIVGSGAPAPACPLLNPLGTRTAIRLGTIRPIGCLAGSGSDDEKRLKGGTLFAAEKVWKGDRRVCFEHPARALRVDRKDIPLSPLLLDT